MSVRTRVARRGIVVLDDRQRRVKLSSGTEGVDVDHVRQDRRRDTESSEVARQCGDVLLRLAVLRGELTHREEALQAALHLILELIRVVLIQYERDLFGRARQRRAKGNRAGYIRGTDSTGHVHRRVVP